MLPTELVAANPYLAFDAVGLAVVALGWLAAGPQRRMMLLAGTMHLLLLPGAWWLAGEVWTPVNVFGGRLSLEDAVYTFVFGAGAWCSATLAFREDYAANANVTLFLRRSALVAAPSIFAYGALLASGLGAVLPAFAIPTAVAGWLLVRHPDLRRLALCGGIGTALVYYAMLRLWFVVWPQARSWWTPDTLWSEDFIGVPLIEAGWALMMGAVHPTVMAFLCDVRRLAEPART